MTGRRTAVLIAGLALAVPAPAVAGHRGWARVSSAGRDLLIGAALGVPAAQGDWRGDLQAAESLLAAGGTTFVLKELIHERRPDGSDDKSFPSGHTAGAVAVARAAARVYPGAVPALAAVTVGVGALQLPTGKHYASDVVAGAAVGLVGEAVVDGIVRLIDRR